MRCWVWVPVAQSDPKSLVRVHDALERQGISCSRTSSEPVPGKPGGLPVRVSDTTRSSRGSVEPEWIRPTATVRLHSGPFGVVADGVRGGPDPGVRLS
jgi:hypothetical protein